MTGRPSLLARVKSVAQRVREGVPLAERPAAFVLGAIADQSRLTTSRRIFDFRYREVRFQARSADWNAVREVLLDGEYEILSQLISSERPAILDLGANIGMFSIRALVEWPGAIVQSYEPDPATFAILDANRGRNPSFAWQCHQAAAWSTRGTIGFTQSNTSTASHISSSESTMKVPAITLQEALRLFDREIDVLKMDIEGAEQSVLEACRDGLEQVRAIIIEVHPDRVDERAVTALLRREYEFLHQVPGRRSRKPLLVTSRRRLNLPMHS